MASVDELVAKFRVAAIAAGRISDTKAQHQAVRELQACFKELRQTQEGRAGVVDLMSDDDPGVRLSAAARCLMWAPERARPVLERIKTEGGFPESFEAEMTLKEFDKGTLSFDF